MRQFKVTLTGEVEKPSDPLAVLSLISGLGLVASSILEFKAHKDNPTQVPISVAVLSLTTGLGFALFGSLELKR